ncbi:hypothetical protein IQ07DRAFT_657054 [Pyrenochaeta sp. DS3sAY3a]|nr:hypothetical protein IQ07DRAFT_657054 [Pyrenochaeta sp. DS3sAY3a]
MSKNYPQDQNTIDPRLLSLQPRLPTTNSRGRITTSQLQQLIHEAHVNVGHRYYDTPYLCSALQEELRDGYDECDVPGTDAMNLLARQLVQETRTLSAFNKHRLGRAIKHAHVTDPSYRGSVEYKEEENIPDLLEFFPLRYLVNQKIMNTSCFNIGRLWQLDGTVEDNKYLISRHSKQNITPAQAIIQLPPNLATMVPAPNSHPTARAAPYNKLADAPPADLGFPTGNITLAELAAFLPQSFRSWDVIERVLFNGAVSVTIALLINHFRIMPNGPIENNTVYRILKGQADKQAKIDPVYQNWSVTKHQRLPLPHGWDHDSVDVTSFQAPAQVGKLNSKRIKTTKILFRDLMHGVKTLPSGDDALDLTRCIMYCVAHPDQDWYYPDHFEQLVNSIPRNHKQEVGPSPVRSGHTDSAIVTRHTPIGKLKGASAVFQRKRDPHGRLVKTEKNDSEDEDVEDEETGTDSEEESDIDSDSEDASPRREAKKQRTKAIPRYRFPENLTVNPSRKGKAPESDSGENTDPPSVPKHTKRKQAFDDDSEDDVRTPKKRRPVATPSPKRKQPAVEDSDSDLEDGSYQGPKYRKKTQAPRRTSGRVRRVIGSYKLDRAAEDVVDEEEGAGNQEDYAGQEEDDSVAEEDHAGDESEDELE